MTPVEQLANYATETKAILYVLVIIIIVLASVLLNIWMLYVLQRMKIRGWRKHEKHLATELAARAAEIVTLRETLGDVEVLKAEIRKLDKIRDKSFKWINDAKPKIETLEIDNRTLANENTSLKSTNEALQGIIEQYRQRFIEQAGEQPAA